MSGSCCALGATITKLDSFIDAGRSATGDSSSEEALVGVNVDLNGWVATRVKDIAANDLGDG